MPVRASFRLRLKLVVLVILSLGAGLITTAGPAHAVDTVVAAAGRAGAGLNGCNSLTGKALHECVAGVLDRLAADIAPTGNTETQGALRTAAAGLRAATTKAQALSAISQCQSVIGAAIRQSRAIGGELVRGWGRAAGLAPIISVLARAARLIQQKG
jgi:hypothetical protein